MFFLGNFYGKWFDFFKIIWRITKIRSQVLENIGFFGSNRLFGVSWRYFIFDKMSPKHN